MRYILFLLSIFASASGLASWDDFNRSTAPGPDAQVKAGKALINGKELDNDAKILTELNETNGHRIVTITLQPSMPQLPSTD